MSIKINGKTIANSATPLPTQNGQAGKFLSTDGTNPKWSIVDLSTKQDKLNQNQLNAVNSGITKDKVSKYDGYETSINDKQPKGNYQTVDNLSQTIVYSTTNYPSNKAIKNYTYSKNEIDGKISGVFKLKGSVNNFESLPTQDQRIGDVWNVLDTGKNYIWTDNGWDDLGGTVDLSNYPTNDDLTNSLNTKQNKLNQNQLNAVNSGITSALVTKYNGYETSINGKQPKGNYQSTANLSQSVDTSTTKYPSNKAVKDAIDAKANDSAVVHKTGDETIGGIKTFQNSTGRNSTIRLKDGTADHGSSAIDLVQATSNGYNQLLIRFDNGNHYPVHIVQDASNSSKFHFYAPTPDNTSNTNEIATTAWVNKKGYATTSALNGRADTNLSNLSQAGKNVIKSYAGGGGIPIGTIFSAPYNNFTPEGAVLANGAEFDATQFPDLFNDFIKAGNVLTCTYSQFDADIAKSGGCAKFALNGNKFRVPKIGGGTFIAGGNGESFAESLPNITGEVGPLDDGSSKLLKGPFYKVRANAYDANSQFAGQGWDLGFDASRSSPVYKNGGKVQPNNVRMKYFVQVASGSINQSMMDWSKYMQGLNGKANTNLSNVSTNIDYVIESKVNTDGSWYRKYKSGWLEQGGIIAVLNNQNVSLLKPYSNSNYLIELTAKTYIANFGYSCSASPINTTSFTAYSGYAEVNGTISMYWFACGKGA